MDDAELRRLVAASRSGVLATVDPDGAPEMSNIYYLADADARILRFSTTTIRRKGRNLQRHRRAAVHVAGHNFLNFAVAEGSVSLAIADRPEDDAVAELLEVHAALGAPIDSDRFGEEMVADHRMLVRLHVERVYGQLIDRKPRIE
jgi:PPOX class probable F420-dependent enzyme